MHANRTCQWRNVRIRRLLMGVAVLVGAPFGVLVWETPSQAEDTKAVSTTTVSSSNNPSLPNEPVTLKVKVTGDVGVPTGTAEIVRNGRPFATVTLDDQGGADIGDVVFTEPGLASFAAYYGGDVAYLASKGAVGQKVYTQRTATSLNSDQNPGTDKRAVILAATVVSESDPTLSYGGPVEFYDGTTLLGRMTLEPNSCGCVQFQYLFRDTGRHSLMAKFIGPSGYSSAPSTSPPYEQIIRVTSKLDVTSSPNPSLAGGKVKLTGTVINPQAGTVRTPPGMPYATGGIEFFDGSTSLGKVLLDRYGKGSLTIALTSGSHRITATYEGDDLYAPLPYSGVVTQTVV